MDNKKKTNNIVDDQTILDLLYGDENYFKEFVLASIESFEEFRENYNSSIRKGNLKVLRDAGHKIKPAALMMDLFKLLEMYEASKKQLENDQTEQMAPIVQEMNDYCDQLLSDLNNMLKR